MTRYDDLLRMWEIAAAKTIAENPTATVTKPDVTKPVTKPVNVRKPTDVTKPNKGGRPRIGDKAMTSAERMRRYRQRKRQSL